MTVSIHGLENFVLAGDDELLCPPVVTPCDSATLKVSLSMRR